MIHGTARCLVGRSKPRRTGSNKEEGFSAAAALGVIICLLRVVRGALQKRLEQKRALNRIRLETKVAVRAAVPPSLDQAFYWSPGMVVRLG